MYKNSQHNVYLRRQRLFSQAIYLESLMVVEQIYDCYPTAHVLKRKNRFLDTDLGHGEKTDTKRK